jgi:putative two-component system response regulator
VARQIRVAAVLHDIGKIKIPRSILDKRGKLSADEFETVKTHTVIGAEMLTSITGDIGEMARACCLYHHEYWNGGGYWGRYTNDLPFYIPMVAISDVFTALISERPYKQAWPPGEALAYIQSQAGTQFSHKLVGVFLDLIQNDSRVPAIFMEGIT